MKAIKLQSGHGGRRRLQNAYTFFFVIPRISLKMFFAFRTFSCKCTLINIICFIYIEYIKHECNKLITGENWIFECFLERKLNGYADQLQKKRFSLYILSNHSRLGLFPNKTKHVVQNRSHLSNIHLFL